jgi:hypothetical protein
LVAPLREAFSHRSDVSGVGTVGGESAVRVALQHPEQVSQDAPVESGIDLLSQLT